MSLLGKRTGNVIFPMKSISVCHINQIKHLANLWKVLKAKEAVTRNPGPCTAYPCYQHILNRKHKSLICAWEISWKAEELLLSCLLRESWFFSCPEEEMCLEKVRTSLYHYCAKINPGNSISFCHWLCKSNIWASSSQCNIRIQLWRGLLKNIFRPDFSKRERDTERDTLIPHLDAAEWGHDTLGFRS